MGAWFAAKGLLGLKNWIWLAILAGIALAAFVAIRGIDNTVEAIIETSKEAGAAEQREGDLREALNRTEEANHARNEVRRPGSNAGYDQCLRTARTPANCERFLPQRPAD